jgi:hypothetical protein
MAFDLSDYNTVPERLQEFFKKHPEGSLQGDYVFERVPMYVKDKDTGEAKLLGEKTFLVYRAKAYRTPDDPVPGVGTAWEPCPGTTPYTRDSEMQNAETSAWGRAIVAVGAADTRKGVASREEVQARRGE